MEELKEGETFVAGILPPEAVRVLIEAARKAKTLPEESLERAKVIRDAIKKIQFSYPRHFR